MFKYLFAKQIAILIAICICLITPAQAATCNVDLKKAYKAAIQKGWKFQCWVKHNNIGVDLSGTAVFYVSRNGNLNCKWSRRPGRPYPPGQNATVYARFFGKNPNGSNPVTHFRNQWQVLQPDFSSSSTIEMGPSNAYGYRVRGHKTRKIIETNGSFTLRLRGLKVKRNNGNCSNFYTEAF